MSGLWNIFESIQFNPIPLNSPFILIYYTLNLVWYINWNHPDLSIIWVSSVLFPAVGEVKFSVDRHFPWFLGGRGLFHLWSQRSGILTHNHWFCSLKLHVFPLWTLVPLATIWWGKLCLWVKIPAVNSRSESEGWDIHNPYHHYPH